MVTKKDTKPAEDVSQPDGSDVTTDQANESNASDEPVVSPQPDSTIPQTPFVLKPFEDLYSAYLKEIDSLYKQSLKEYEQLLTDYAKGMQEKGSEYNIDKDKIDQALKDSLVDAWRKSANYVTYAQLQDQSLKELSQSHQVKNKEAENLQSELVDSVNGLNKKYKDLFKEAFAKYNGETIRSLSAIKQEDIEANALYALGCLNIASAWYGFITTS